MSNISKRKKSAVWQFFRATSNNKAFCNLCLHHLSYKTTTTNLMRHLQRRHPGSFVRDPLANDNSIDNSFEQKPDVTKEHSDIDVNELIQNESIVIEYCDDNNVTPEKKETTTKQNVLRPKILRIPISNKISPIEKPSPGPIKKEELNTKFSNLADARNELIRIEIASARKDLELKEKQLIYAQREDERKQKEHEITLRIKEAQLQAILIEQSAE